MGEIDQSDSGAMLRHVSDATPGAQHDELFAMLRSLIARLERQHERDRAEIARLDVALVQARAEVERMRPVYEVAKAWRAGRMPVDAEACERLEAAVDAALDGRWARCEEPPQSDGVAACAWAGEMQQLRRDRDGVTRCPACGATAIAEDLAPPTGSPAMREPAHFACAPNETPEPSDHPLDLTDEERELLRTVREHWGPPEREGLPEVLAERRAVFAVLDKLLGKEAR